MISLDNGDKLQGDTTTASKVDYTIQGVVGTTLSQQANGQLANSKGDLYTSSADGTVVAGLTLVNTNTSAEAVNLYLLPSGGTARRIIPKDMSLGVGYSLIFDGNIIQVFNASGEILYNPAGLTSADSPQFTGVNVGHATDTTIARVSAGLISVEGSNLIRASDVDDTPVDEQTAVPVSSNWAYDHNAATPSASVHPISDNVDFNLNQAVDLVVMTVANEAALPTEGIGVGQLCFATSELTLHICTVSS